MNDSVNYYDKDGQRRVTGWNPDGTETKQVSPTCAYTGAYELKSKINPNLNDKYKHCVISCYLTWYCGPSQSWGAGAAKEAKDLLDMNHKTNPEWEDIKANKEGRKCADCTENSCEDCCVKKYKPI